MPEVQEILSLAKTLSKEEISLIKKAYAFAEKVHEGQKRYSGEPFFNHIHETAKNLAKYGQSGATIAAGILHDSIEDTVITASEIKEKFGDEILFLIQGVTKLGALKYKGVKRHSESLRKLFVAMSEDIRVLVIKLTDRLHNMQTLKFMPKDKQERIALETMEIYTPLAYRLGMSKLGRELEDLAFKYLDPESYEKILAILEKRVKKEKGELEKISKTIKKALAKEKIRVIKTEYRVKGLKSIDRKIKQKKEEESVHDILALRIIVPTIDDCYKTLGIVHRLWRPMPGRIKDFIAFPKTNGYQSLHTTVFSGGENLFEIQIRTEKMDYEATYGVAAHAVYKGEKKMSWIGNFFGDSYKPSDEEGPPAWVKGLSDYQKGYTNASDFVKDLKRDFFGERIFALTPNGDAIDLPVGSSPIDFAYAIHSDIGDHLSGAKINGKLSSIETELKNGDIVKIITAKKAEPTRKWLSLAKTSTARRDIKRYLGIGKKK